MSPCASCSAKVLASMDMNTQGVVGDPVRWQIVTCCPWLCAAITRGMVSTRTNAEMSTKNNLVAIPEGCSM
jgi:hypothetical protein